MNIRALRARTLIATITLTAATLAGQAMAGTELTAGTLLTARITADAAGVPHAGRVATLAYMSEDAHGEPIVVSGAVYVPRGAAPAAGWPLISWAHGTTGAADTCAPSNALDLQGPEQFYLAMMAGRIDHWLARGYAVVATDYEGLGTPGVHPYMNGRSAANTVEDIVVAARQWEPSIGKRWVAIGHSQGGAAAMFAAAQANKRAPDLALVAAVAMAPGGFGLAQVLDYLMSNPDDRTAIAYTPIIFVGTEAGDPSLDLRPLLTPAGAEFVYRARIQCASELWLAASTAPHPLLEPGADVESLRKHLKKYLQAQDIVNAQPAVPLMVVLGEADSEVARDGIDVVVEGICKRNVVPVDYRLYKGIDHLALLQSSEADIDDYLDRVLRRGEAPENSCPS